MIANCDDHRISTDIQCFNIVEARLLLIRRIATFSTTTHQLMSGAVFVPTAKRSRFDNLQQQVNTLVYITIAIST